MSFTGRNGIVTGSGSGLGRAVTLKLASEGATVVGVDISERPMLRQRWRQKIFLAGWSHSEPMSPTSRRWKSSSFFAIDGGIMTV